MSDLHPKITIPTASPKKICIVPLPTVPNLPAIVKVGTGGDNPVSTPVELVAGLIHTATKIVIAGQSKSGKTWMLLYLGLCINAGMPFLNRPTKKCRVFYINFEILASFMTERVRMLMKHMGLQSADNLDIWNLRGFAGDFEALWAEILRAVVGKDYALIIIDPIYKLMNGKSENGAAGVAILCSRLEQLAEKSGAAVLFAHHFAKGDSKKKSVIDRMSGSGVFARDSDATDSTSGQPH